MKLSSTAIQFLTTALIWWHDPDGHKWVRWSLLGLVAITCALILAFGE